MPETPSRLCRDPYWGRPDSDEGTGDRGIGI